MAAHDKPWRKVWGCQAITTRYLAPTNPRGGRVKARATASELTVGWEHADNVEQNHARAAYLLATKLGWEGDWRMGAMPGKSNRDTYVFVLDRGKSMSVVSEPCNAEQEG